LLKYTSCIVFIGHTLTCCRWIKRYNLDDEFGHLKRIRKQGDLSSLVITGSQHTIPPWPEELEVSEPYLTVVPASSALTATSWALKNTLWPTVFTPSRKDEPEPWTRGKVQWSNRAASIILKEAQAAQNRGEVTFQLSIRHRVLNSRLPAAHRSVCAGPLRSRGYNRHSIPRCRHSTVYKPSPSPCRSQCDQENCRPARRRN